MKSNRTKIIILLLIVVVAFIVRVFRVSTIPPSLSWDEVSIGYNAYSILKTGRDEHQRLFPLDTFIAYGDYKPPVPIYITVPFVAVFGLNEFAVRFPVVLFSTFTVLLTYFLVVELFSSYHNKRNLGLITSAVLAFSPWHINLSRAGFEAVIALFLIVFSVVLFLYALRKNKLLYVAFIPLALAIYTFNSARYFAPFLGIILLVSFRKKVFRAKKEIVGGIIIASVVLLPIIPHLLSPEARLRFKEVNIFSDVELVKLANMRAEAAGNTLLAKVIHNRRIYYGLAFVKHYLDHFEPRFLFIQGDGNPKFSIQDVGQLYILEAPLLIIGILTLLAQYPAVATFLLLWLGFAIVPAATARETPHALRILNTLPTWHIFIAFGILSILSLSEKKIVKKIIIGTVMTGYGFFILFYLHTYYFHYPIEYSGEWQFGYKEAFTYAESVKDQYNKIIVTDYIGRPYAYALFYGKYEPAVFWKTKQSSFDAAGFYNVYGFDKYQFVRAGNQNFEKGNLYILSPGNVPSGATEVLRVNLLNGNLVLIGFHL